MKTEKLHKKVKSLLHLVAIVTFTLMLQSCSFVGTLKFLGIAIAVFLVALIGFVIVEMRLEKKRKVQKDAFEQKLAAAGGNEHPMTYGRNRLTFYYYPSQHRLVVAEFSTKDSRSKDIPDFDISENLTLKENSNNLYFYDCYRNKILYANTNSGIWKVQELPAIDNPGNQTIERDEKTIKVTNRGAGKVIIFKNGNAETYDFPPASPNDVMEYDFEHSYRSIIKNISKGVFYYYKYGKQDGQTHIPVSTNEDRIELLKQETTDIIVNYTTHNFYILKGNDVAHAIKLPGEISESIVLDLKELRCRKLGDDICSTNYFMVMFFDNEELAVFIRPTGEHFITPYTRMSLVTNLEDKYQEHEKRIYKGESGYKLDPKSLFTMEDRYVNTKYYDTKRYSKYVGTKVTLTLHAGDFSHEYVVDSLFYMMESRRDKGDLEDLMKKAYGKIAPLSKRCFHD